MRAGHDGRWRGHGLAAVVATCVVTVFAFGVFAAWWQHLRPPLTGDEPHYLVIARSIAIDHDLDLRDDYPRLAAVYPPKLPVGHHAVAMRADRRLRPIQGLGLGFILAPAWLISSTPSVALIWARRIMMLIAAGLVGETHWLARRLEPRRPWAAWVASGAMIVALPYVGYSNQLYPEIPAAFLAVAALIASHRANRVSRVLVGSSAGLLVWLSPRYAPIAVGLLTWQILGDLRRTGTPRRQRLLDVGTTLLPVAVAVVFLAGWYQYAFGTLSLQRIYRAAGIPVGHSALVVYQRSAGSLLDPVGGLLPYAPVLVLGAVGFGALWRAHRDATIILLLAGSVYFVAFASAGFRGYALPGRMAIVTMPIFALGLASLASRAQRRTLAAVVAACVALGVISIAITVQSAHRDTYGRLYRSDSVPADPIVARVASIWPRFTASPSTASNGARLSTSTRNAPIRRDIPISAAWIAALAAAAALVGYRRGPDDISETAVRPTSPPLERRA